ncbi:hypothetical protein A2881_01905 [Candidatus Peribacteria bacterium RIFCSPHIGHO2_01_FULL_55_13]|nr:MAG: hypothetical protein A2881_01905 [Candidatus Peribacteria bacterium RIFCSPHIGHO2_01_FULL_55_13]OGJ66536.1 MAG: hypothetical protein A3F36_05700 [Candidatus Peribacteria bacterium RIFCSPHIGHO2_12_FULL_55_11]
MKRPYHKLLQYSFKRFSVLSARRTALPTIAYYLKRPALEKSDKPALCTMNILPPMMTVWYHCAKKFMGDKADIWIFDCSGKLDPADFPGARVQKFLNFYAATKCDEFLYSIARNRRLGWICDDDIFLLSPGIVPLIERECSDPQTASLSFRPRRWKYTISGKEYEASSSYCTVINRDIFCNKEHLSLKPAEGNSHSSKAGLRRYDTFDKANEILLSKGYRCPVLPEKKRSECIAGFSGMSGGVMLLNYFKTPEQTMEYFHGAPVERWGANMLHGILAAMLGISCIQELAEKISGKRYPLPSLPSRNDLEKLRRDHEHLIKRPEALAWMDETCERLRNVC